MKFAVKPFLALTARSAVLGIVAATWLIGLAAAQDAGSLREAVECHPRSGLPNFRGKVEAGKTVRVAYLGGSITAAPGWRVQSREWLSRQYPQVQIEEIHAAIGGTGSDLGVFRFQNDVLRHRPDLVFVEFAVNDGGAAPEQIHKAMEGIVRQAWRADPAIDLCFVYTVSEPVLPQLRSGKMQRSASAMEELADWYQIPSIHFGVQVVRLEKVGELVFKAPRPSNLNETRPLVFSTDGVHPHVETGHRLYTEAIARSWPVLWNVGARPVAHELVKPLRSDNWEQAKQVAITPEMLRGDWKALSGDDPLAKRFQRNMPQLYRAQSAGAELAFTFHGTTAAVFDLVGPDGGRLSLQVDDRSPVLQNRFDAYCTYHRMSKLNVAHDLPAGRHEVRITLTPETLEKRKILFEHNRADFDQHPEKYAGQTWVVGSLLIIGDIVVDGHEID